MARVSKVSCKLEAPKYFPTMSSAVSQQGYNSLDKEEAPEPHGTKLIRTLVLGLSFFFVVRMP